MIIADAISCDLQLKEIDAEQNMLNLLWDISFGKGLSSTTLALAQRFSKQEP